MSTSDSTIKGKFDELAGKAKQAFGETTGNSEKANKGAAQEVKGHAEQSWGSVKEAVHDNGDHSATGTTSEGHGLRDKVTSVAANVKEHIQNATHRD